MNKTSKEYERISSLLKKVQRERFPELNSEIILLEERTFSSEKDDGTGLTSISAMGIIDNEISYRARITKYLPDDAMDGAIGHELAHAFLGHNSEGIEKYMKDKEYKDVVERAADEETKKRGLEKELELFYVLEDIWWKKLEVTKKDIKAARRKIYT